MRSLWVRLVSLSLSVGLLGGWALQAGAQGLSLDDRSASEGETVTFTVSVTNAPSEADALGFDVTFDPAVLGFVEFTRGALSQSWTLFDVGTPEAGRIRVGGLTTGAEIIAAGATGDLARLDFTVLGAGATDLSIEATVDDIRSWAVDGGSFVPGGCPDRDADTVCDADDNCPDAENGDQTDRDGDAIGDACECGDASGDGRVNSTDARLIQRCVVGQIPCGTLCDVTGEGACNTTDARLIQRLAVGQLAKGDLSCAERP